MKLIIKILIIFCLLFSLTESEYHFYQGRIESNELFYMPLEFFYRNLYLEEDVLGMTGFLVNPGDVAISPCALIIKVYDKDALILEETFRFTDDFLISSHSMKIVTIKINEMAPYLLQEIRIEYEYTYLHHPIYL